MWQIVHSKKTNPLIRKKKKKKLKISSKFSFSLSKTSTYFNHQPNLVDFQ